jgi:hypothetical protein
VHAGFGKQKGRQWKTACREKGKVGLNVGLCFAKALDAIAGLPLTALFQQVHAFKAFEDVAFDDEAGGALETFVLRHGG